MTNQDDPTSRANTPPDGDDLPDRDDLPDGTDLRDPDAFDVRSGSGASSISRPTIAMVAALGAIVLLIIGATAGIALFSNRDTGADHSVPAAGSVDAGFAQDMIVHHGQGVLMAHYAELDTGDPDIARLAYDIGYTQTDQIGQMQAWLQMWGIPEVSTAPHMAWMTTGGHEHGGGSDTPMATTGLMPGMATDEEMARLESLRGKESDIYFLQLMIRHHEGGAPMMAYAAAHAENPVVRNLAKQMLISQTGEVGVMKGMLADLGAEPLPFTAPELDAATTSAAAAATTSGALDATTSG